KEKGFKRFFFEDLLHSDDAPLKKSLSVALGVLIGVSPFWGFQTLIVLFLACVLRLNKLIAFAFSNVSIPPLIPFVVYACLETGTFVLGQSSATASFNWHRVETYRPFIQQHLTEYIVGSFVFGIVTATLAGSMTYLLLTIRTHQNPG